MTLSEARKARGLSQRELAKRVGLSEKTINLLEVRRRIRISTMAAVAHELGRTIELVVDPDGSVTLSALRDRPPNRPRRTP